MYFFRDFFRPVSQLLPTAAGCGSASALTAPCLGARAMIASLVTSLYRTKIKVEPLPSSLIFGPTGGYHLYAGDRGISLTRDHQVQVSWFAITTTQLWPAAMLWMCSMAQLIFQSRRTSPKTFSNRFHYLAQQSWNPVTCSVPPSSACRIGRIR